MKELTPSLKTLNLFVNENETGSNLLISCIDPYFIKGLVYWSNSSFHLEAVELPDGSGLGYKLFDSLANFEVVSGGLEVKENIKMRI